MGVDFISEPPKKTLTVNRAKAKSKEDGDEKQYKMKDGPISLTPRIVLAP